MTLREQLHEGRLLCPWHYLDSILCLPQQDGACTKRSASQRGGTDSTAGVDFPTAVRYANEGWPEGAAAALNHEHYATLFATATALTTKHVLNEESGEVQWDRVMSGETACLLEAMRIDARTRAVRIVCVSNIRGNVDSDTALARAIEIAAGIAQMETLGHKIELWSTIVNWDNSERPVSFTFNVHNTGDFFNLGRIAFCLGHPAFGRRIGWALKERASRKVQAMLGPEYGQPYSLGVQTLASLQLPPWEGDTLLFNGASSISERNVEQTRAAFLKLLTNGDSAYEDALMLQVSE